MFEVLYHPPSQVKIGFDPPKLQHFVFMQFLAAQGLLNNISKVDLWGLTGSGLIVMLKKLTIAHKMLFLEFGV